jgi:hypothetical protein
MIHIKKGQGSISDFIKTDIDAATLEPKFRDAVIHSLNSGKRIRSLISGVKEQAALSVEYIYTGLMILNDATTNRQKRRGSPSLFVKYGTVTASLIANWLIVRGLKYIDPSVRQTISDLVEEELTYEFKSSLPPRAIKAHHGRMFVVAFIVATGSTEPDIMLAGENFGYCYGLASSSDTITENHQRQFSALMQETLTEFTRLKLWTPMLKELTSYILAKFEKLKIKG